MPERDPIETLRQIAQFAGEAKRLGEDGSRELIERDLRYLRAAERVVELIREASARLAPELRDRHPQVPWRAIIAMRNRLIHGYDGVDYEILWDVLARRAPDLVRELPKIIQAEGGDLAD